MIDFIITLKCKFEGLFFNHVKIDLKSRFNRHVLFSGIKSIKGIKLYPIVVKQSNICGNISAKYGTSILRSDLNTGENGSINIDRFSIVNGTEVSAGENCVYIGSFCSIANGTRFLTAGHDMNRPTTYYMSRHVFKEKDNREIKNKGDIVVEDDVWIGANSIILGGVNVGRGSVIAAGSIITKDVLPFSVVGGNPAKLIRMRFNSDTIDYLHRSNWWSWDIEKLKNQKGFFKQNLNEDENCNYWNYDF